jgi:hypothetical protein
MTIRILTCHPALLYVLSRTAPLGMTVREMRKARHGHEALYSIGVHSSVRERKSAGEMLGAWLPGYLQQYGARRVEIDGRPIPCDEHRLRNALLGGPIHPAVRFKRVGEQIAA